MDTVELFNLKFSEFLEDLVASYPDETDLQAMHNMLAWTVKMMGPNVPQEMFNLCVAIPYGDKISAKNESFFLEECEYDTRYADINIINKLKAKWKNLSNDNREIVWKYMHVLMLLNTKCMEKQKPI